MLDVVCIDPETEFRASAVIFQSEDLRCNPWLLQSMSMCPRARLNAKVTLTRGLKLPSVLNTPGVALTKKKTYIAIRNN